NGAATLANRDSAPPESRPPLAAEPPTGSNLPPPTVGVSHDRAPRPRTAEFVPVRRCERQRVAFPPVGSVVSGLVCRNSPVGRWPASGRGIVGVLAGLSSFWSVQGGVMQSRLMARLTAPIAAVSLVLLTIALGAAWYIHSTQQAIARLLTNDVASVRAAQELEISIRRVQMQFDRYLITGERTHLEGVPAHRDRAFRALEAAERLAFTEPEKALMQRVRHGYEHFFAEYDKLTASPPPHA